MKQVIIVMAFAAVLVFSVRAEESGTELKPIQPNLIRNGAFKPDIDHVTPRDWQLDVFFASPRHARIDFFANGMTVRPLDLAPVGFYQYVWGDETPAYRLKCRVKQEAGGAERATIALQPIDRVSGSRRSPKDCLFSCSPDGQWHDVSLNIDGGDHAGFAVFIKVPKTVTAFSVESLTVEGVFPKPEEDAAVIFGGPAKTVLKGIVIANGADAMEQKAAAAIRVWIYQVSGQVVPIFAVGPAREQGFLKTLGFGKSQPSVARQPGYFYVGNAAVDAGAIAEADLAAIGRNGYVIKSVGDVVGVAGRQSGGTLCGAKRLGEILGVKHFAPRVTEIKRQNPLVIPELTEHRDPAFDFANVGDQYINGVGDDDAWRYGYLPIASTMGDPGNAEPASFAGWVHPALFLAPPYLYADTRPEFYAMDKKGKRMTFKDVSDELYLNLCLGGAGLQQTASDRIEKLIETQPEPEYYSVAQADGTAWCECPECRALDVDTARGMDRLMAYANHVAEKVGKKYPDKKILILAYGAFTEELPLRVKPVDNVAVMFALWPSSWPIWEDTYNPRNARGQKLLADWNRLMPGRILTFLYPVNVYENAEKIRYCSTRDIRGFFQCGFRGEFPEVMCYVSGRMIWEPEADVEAMIDEIMPALYGKEAAPFMRQYFNALHGFLRQITGPAAGDDYQKYFEYNLHRLKKVPGPYFENCYALLTQAENAAKNHPEYLSRIHGEKCRLLFAELNSRNPATARMDDAAFATYAARLAELVQLASERAHNLPFAFYNVPFPEWLRQTTGGKVEFAGGAYRWSSDPKVKEFLKDSFACLKKEKRIQTVVPGGWELPANAFFGGDYMENYARRQANVARREGSEKSRLRAALYLDAASIGNDELRLLGMDNDKKEKALISVKINGREIYSGPVAFEKKRWSEMTCKIPVGVLKAGENAIVIENITPGAVAPDGAAGPAEAAMNKSYNWGWFIIGTAKVIAVGK